MTTIELADNLQPTPRNIDSATAAYERLAEAGWTAIGGYPGSDVHWHVRCEFCGWEGNMFFSHMRRDDKHGNPKRHRGCVPVAKRADALAEWIAASTSKPSGKVPGQVRAERVADEGKARAAHVEVETGPPKAGRGKRNRAASAPAGSTGSDSHIAPTAPAETRAARNSIRVRQTATRKAYSGLTRLVTVIHVNCACKISAGTLVGEYADMRAADQAAAKAADGTGDRPKHCARSGALI